MKLHAKTLGSGKDIVLLHGWGFHSGIWQPILADLLKRFRVTLIDLPGFGLTPLFSYSFSSLCNKILEVTPEQAVYLGWSLGGLLAMGMACQFSSQIEAIVAIGSTPRFIATKKWPGVSRQDFQAFHKAVKEDTVTTLRRFCFSICSQQEREQFSAQLFAVMMEYGCPSTEALCLGLETLKKVDLRQAVTKLHCPQLYLNGSEDKLSPPALLSRYYSTIVNSETCLLTGAGHVPFLTQKTLFLKKIFKFLGV